MGNRNLESLLPQMVELYFEQKKSLNDVATVLGCVDKSVEYHLKKNGYKLRTRSESLKGREVSEKARETARILGRLRVGEKSPVWKGRVKRGGYFALRKPNHPFASQCGYVMEHRIIMEEKIGRFLRPDEDVHHINEVKTDNRIENLELLSKSNNSRMHGKNRVANGTHNNYIHVTNEEIKEDVLAGGEVKEMAARINLSTGGFYQKLERQGLKKWYQEWRIKNDK